MQLVVQLHGLVDPSVFALHFLEFFGNSAGVDECWSVTLLPLWRRLPIFLITAFDVWVPKIVVFTLCKDLCFLDGLNAHLHHLRWFWVLMSEVFAFCGYLFYRWLELAIGHARSRRHDHMRVFRILNFLWHLWGKVTGVSVLRGSRPLHALQRQYESVWQISFKTLGLMRDEPVSCDVL